MKKTDQGCCLKSVNRRLFTNIIDYVAVISIDIVHSLRILVNYKFFED